MSVKGLECGQGCIGPVGPISPRDEQGFTRQEQIEKHLTILMNLLGVKAGNFVTKEIKVSAKSNITELDERIVNICKSCGHALSICLSGHYITDDRELEHGWWDSMCPCEIMDRFKYNKCFQWLNDNIRGAKFLYELTTFWGCNHTKWYVFEYKDGTYRLTSETFATT